MKKSNILIVDDNRSVQSALDLLLSPYCANLKCLSSPKTLFAELQSNDYDVVLLDMNFTAGINNGNEGIYWLSQILEQYPRVSVVMITAYGDVELAVKAVRLGATDFVLKPWDNEKMIATVDTACKLSQSKKELKKMQLKEKQLIEEINGNSKDLIGSSATWERAMKMVRKVADTNANVLITGENGTGKELIAREIHRLSKRSNKVMVSVDMGAVAESLFESELFGHKKGAFTDAHSDRMGKIEAANKGTLFLDEIGNLSMPMQAKLLSVLQNRLLTKVGDNSQTKVDLRLICATNGNLQQMVSDGKFREDLLYRINTIHIEVPPLRDRKDDIPELAEFFVQKYADKYGKDLKITSQAIAKLTDYAWPGNVRELQHSVEKAVILSDHPQLAANDFVFKNDELNNVNNFGGTLEDMEAQLIASAIEKHAGNLSAVSGQLGISRQTLYNKIKKYGL
ncbi:sigma-54-dependent transcriptional regulator [Marinifilum caeruleilacunae]|uniref:Sigma-54-dependent Fis family transcriptional regulator n=1 Tax=Marinifilum caeruleilacunae TaxID=2499076 RepID=A0ABX1WS19_9BACT|nr:sigma-54 dependent transcriptional regulator [Marinifilum caeruleilacunae]NOU58863.1 sigma-54-dependent Fis family transcriptional regulator [Marinifilum caeruleilacunae]